MNKKMKRTVNSTLLGASAIVPIAFIATSCNDTAKEEKEQRDKELKSFEEIIAQLQSYDNQLKDIEISSVQLEIRQFIKQNKDYEQASLDKLKSLVSRGIELLNQIETEYQNQVAFALNNLKEIIQELTTLNSKLTKEDKLAKQEITSALNQTSQITNKDSLNNIRDWNSKLANLYNKYKELANKSAIDPEQPAKKETVSQINKQMELASALVSDLETKGYKASELSQYLSSINVDALTTMSLANLETILANLKQRIQQANNAYDTACNAIIEQLKAIVSNIQALGVTENNYPEAYKAVVQGLKANDFSANDTLKQLNIYLSNLTNLYQEYKEINKTLTHEQILKEQAKASLNLEIAKAKGIVNSLANNGYNAIELGTYLASLTIKYIDELNLAQLNDAIKHLAELQQQANNAYAQAVNATITTIEDLISKIKALGIDQIMDASAAKAIAEGLKNNTYSKLDSLSSLKNKVTALQTLYNKYKDLPATKKNEAVTNIKELLAQSKQLVTLLANNGYQASNLDSYIQSIKEESLTSDSYKELLEIINQLQEQQKQANGGYNQAYLQVRNQISSQRDKLLALGFSQEYNPKVYNAISQALNQNNYTDATNLKELNAMLENLKDVYKQYKDVPKVDPKVQLIRDVKLKLTAAQATYDELKQKGYQDNALETLLNQNSTSSLTQLNTEQLQELEAKFSSAIKAAFDAYNTLVTSLKQQVSGAIQALKDLHVDSKQHPQAAKAIEQAIENNTYDENSNVATLQQALNNLQAIYNQYKDINQEQPDNFNWGSVPLPRVKDNEITQEMLIKMFDTLIGSKVVTFTLGDRLIDTDTWNNAFLQWQFTNKANYSYFTVDSNQMGFRYKNADRSFVSDGYFPNTPEYVNDKKWYVDSGSFKYTYMEDFRTPGQVQNVVFDFIQQGMSQIKEGMSQWDKAFALWKFVRMWFVYQAVARLDIAIAGHTGVCRDIATSYAILLQMAGIKAFAWPTGKANNLPGGQDADAHMVTWMKLPVNQDNMPDPNSTTYKWFDSDITYEAPEPYYLYPLSHYRGDFGGIITSPSTSQFVPNMSGNLNPYNFNNLYDLPFNTFYLNNEVALNSERDYLASKTILGGNTQVPYGVLPNYVYNNKKWYGIVYTPKMITSDGKQVAPTARIIQQDFSQAYGDEVSWDVASLYKDQIAAAIAHSYSDFWQQPNFAINIYSYKDTISFPIYDNKNGYSIVIYNLKDKSHQLVALGHKDKHLYNFNIQNDQVYVTWADNKKIETPIENTGLASWFSKQVQFTKQDLINQLAYYKFVMGGYVVGNDVYQVSQANHDAYLATWNKIQLQSQQDLSQVQIAELIKQLEENYTNNLLNPAYNKAKTILITRNLNEFDSLSLNQYDQYGYKIEISAINGKSQILQGNLSLRANVYYSQTKLTPGASGWRKIISNSAIDALKLTKNIIESPNGYYYVEIYNQIFPSDTVNSEVLQLQCSNTAPIFDWFSRVTVNGNSQSSNYNATNENWDQDNWLEFTFAWFNSDTYPINADIHFVDFDTKNDQVIKSFSNVTGNAVKWRESLGTISNSNSGIYYVVYTITDKKTNTSYKVISSLTFVFTKTNWEQLTIQELKELSLPIYKKAN
ncbi:hypothetical protein [Mycoplasma sp. MV126]|uniref:hypothetical protein n=1 Tax=Mycoplasma sp. MV126 TaxID=3401676 RepID=UPI003AAA6CEC